ncbi:MAG: quaternary ammonium compound efflux SMR transporter SugE [Planctomycetales bacterium]|nr:quaternary ammonium compound efflux SMR transporter SugE [Planctomycetales bacterium]
MAWVILFIAGLLETGWAIGLKYTDGFRKPVPSVLTILAIASSVYLLAWSAKTLPIGTAYAVWTGIGTTGAAILGILLLKEPASPARIFFLILLLAAIAGLKLTTIETPPLPPQ